MYSCTICNEPMENRMPPRWHLNGGSVCESCYQELAAGASLTEVKLRHGQVTEIQKISESNRRPDRY